MGAPDLPQLIAELAQDDAGPVQIFTNDPAGIAQVIELFKAAKPAMIVIEATGGFDRPPLERSEAVVRLYTRAREIARELGQDDLAEGGTGGGSDGNFTAALGLGTLLRGDVLMKFDPAQITH